MDVYVNASGKKWDDLIIFYLMVYTGTPYSMSGYSPYYLLLGREMILPTSQELRVKLTLEFREAENAHVRKLEVNTQVSL
jgi:hypothetical protein